VSTKSDISVAIVEPNGGYGGMDYYDLGLCRGLLAAGCRVALYTCDETLVPKTPGLHFHPYYKRVFGRGNRWLRAIRYIRGSLASLAMTILSGERILHFHLGPGSIPELLLVAMSKLLGKKIVITVHDVESFAPSAVVNRSVIAHVYRLADRLVVHNLASKRELIEKLGMPADTICIVPHGNYISSVISMPESADAKRSLGIGESRRVILFFGQIKDVKGLDLLIDAIPAVACEIPDVTLLIAGRPWKSDFTHYEARMAKLGILSRCILHIRFIPNAEVARYFAAADVVVLPYRRIYQSGVLLMAMSYRKPVVVSDLQGMTELVTNLQNGYVFALGTKDALSNQLIRALRDEQERELIATRAFKYVSENHDWMQIGRSTREIYLSILSA